MSPLGALTVWISLSTGVLCAIQLRLWPSTRRMTKMSSSTISSRSSNRTAWSLQTVARSRSTWEKPWLKIMTSLMVSVSALRTIMIMQPTPLIAVVFRKVLVLRKTEMISDWSGPSFLQQFISIVFLSIKIINLWQKIYNISHLGSDARRQA